MKKKEERQEKLMAEISAENKRLTEPLTKARAEVADLQKQVCMHVYDWLMDGTMVSMHWPQSVL